jgi:hypothetical protein
MVRWNLAGNIPKVRSLEARFHAAKKFCKMGDMIPGEVRNGYIGDDSDTNEVLRHQV